MRKFRLAHLTTLVLTFCTMAGVNSSAQTYQLLATFDGTNGAQPQYAFLTQGLDGNIYGTTSSGGTNSKGTVFRVTPEGTLTTLYNFCGQAKCTDGSEPEWGLVLATNGNFYGTTYYGGAYNEGTVFEITSAGELTTLYSFCAQARCPDGAFPNALIQGSDGNLYGVTEYGGLGASYGSVFKITLAGKLTTLHSFMAYDGAYPTGSLLQASNGDFYGTTFIGGALGNVGTIFQITAAGKFSTLHNFNTYDGASPTGQLVQSSNGNIYGATAGGGVYNNEGCLANGCGTLFKITTGGSLTTLYKFCTEDPSCNDGEGPYGGMLLATNGELYGTTSGGGLDGNGLIFQMSPTGNPKNLYNFCPEHSCAGGASPYAGLLQSTSGTFYGTTNYGGANGDGTIFSLADGLGPFVKTLPTSAKTGATITILGSELTGTTAVSFNGEAASFAVVSATEITATVPPGATSGTVSVKTPAGTLDSNISFRVIQ